MVGFIGALALLFVALLAITLQKEYGALPERELKRRARQRDPLAQALFRAVAYGASLRALLWTIAAIALAGAFVLLARITWPVAAFAIEALLIGLGLSWVPAERVTRTGGRLVLWATPAVVWLLRHVHPFFDRIAEFVRRHRPVTIHTGLYEPEDLLALLDRQQHQPDSRFSPAELSLLTHALTFGDKLVRDCMVPRREVKLVAASDTVGPVLMEELHASGHSRFPVYEGADDALHIIGTLHLRHVVKAKHGGTVRSLMEHAVFYVHEDYSLEQVLHAFLTTKHHLFIVVNSFEEFVGIITIEDVLEQILGCQIVDEFDKYDDPRAVAAEHARADHAQRTHDGQEPVPAPKAAEGGEEPPEVVK